MKPANQNLHLISAARLGVELNPAPVPAAREISATDHNGGNIVHSACAEVVARWRRAGLSEAEAFEQARYFAARAAAVAAGSVYRTQLEAVAEAMQ